MPTTPRPRVALACALALPLLLAGCAGAVEVGVPGAAGSPACTAASEHWPQELSGQAPVETDPSDPAVRAWGDPAIVARCGVPAMPPTDEQCVVVDEIGWVAEDLGDGTRLTSFGHDPAIEVIVPQEQGPGPLLLPAFSEAVEELPTNGRECS